MDDWKAPIHPGEILADELEEIGISGLELAKRLRIPNNRVHQVLAAKRSITADTALRLGKFFGTGPEFWLNLQRAYELETAQVTIGEGLETIVPYQGGHGQPTPVGA